MKKPSAERKLKDLFIEKVKNEFPEFILMKPTPEKSLPGSLVFRKIICNNSTVRLKIE